MEKEDKLLLAQIQDKFHQCQQWGSPVNTGFLDSRQRSLAEALCNKVKGSNYRFDGGYEEAERKICIILPDASWEYSPLCLLRIHKKSPRVLSHRDYLGSILGLGIQRSQVGDILVGPDGADVIILEDRGEFFLSSLEKVAKIPVEVELVDVKELILGEDQKEEAQLTVSSLRLDNLTAAAFQVSRGDATEAIRKGIIFVNGMAQTKVDRNVQPGDKLVFRGKGKIIFSDILGNTKKDKIAILIQRFS